MLQLIVHYYLFALILIFYFPTQLFGEGEKQKLLFIVNPISHELKGQDVHGLIAKNLDLSIYEYKIVETEYPQHAVKIAQEAIDSTDAIIAVGGDGTVNEVGTALINTDTALGIVPVGSGNGFARHLKIPVGLTEGIKALNKATITKIDTAKINDTPFLGVAGIGFDACIAHAFAQFGQRGYMAYCQVALKEYSRYQPKSFLITMDGKQIKKNAFVVTFANSSQYGNDFSIAPRANISDGYLDLVFIYEFSVFSIPKLIHQFKTGTLESSSYFETYLFKELVVKQPHFQAHIDGEPVFFENEIKVTVQPASLKVMVP